MRNLELSSAEFRRAEGATMEQAAAQFGEFVRRNPIRTEYALYAEFLGAPATGISEVRGILVDKKGTTMWSDRQTPQDAAFKEQKPRDPMECAVLLVRRLRETLGLQDPFRTDRERGAAFFVHFVVCDPSGEWVIVDFQSVAPKSADDCDRLIAKRVAGYLR
jgi:hypothetical protein